VAGGDFWPHLGIRDGKWKLMVNQKLKRTELYDIEADWAEKNDLSKKFPDVTKKLTDKVLAWEKTLPLSSPGDCLSKFRKK
jgi:N-acetylgalactosamine-6-sulfatase